MDAHGMRRKDTTRGPPLRILTLDGGGVRGYSMLILLQELMHRTFVETEGRAPKRHEIPKPCEHFDIIAGTGTGGLIAIMLGRLRLDLETCKDVYVRMTKRVFETDKTIAGIPYRSTLFKASKLEDAIRECVRQHTVDPDEGNDMDAESSSDVASPLSPMVPGSAYNAPHRTASNASRYSQIGTTPVNYQRPLSTMRLGNSNALLYDRRENRCKTAVTAVYKGTPRGGSSILLRSYDSRKEPAPEFNCTIWQAGRATAATGLAFKPIQIGQSVFLDEGAGKYNPAPQILDEAVCNEYPGRDVGVLISIGTGKRPPGTNQQQHLWWEGFVASGMGDFAEARRRLINKIEGCEETHQYMLKEHLARRQVNQENYYRLNVEVGVGEFGMNEWNRLADISTNTRMYLAKHEVQSMNLDAASKLARIHRAKQRWDRAMNGSPMSDSRFSYEEESSSQQPMSVPPPSNPIAVELPAEDVMPPSPRRPYNADLLYPSQFHRRRSSDEKMVIFSDELPEVIQPRQRGSGEYRRSSELDATNPRGSNGSVAPSPRRSGEDPRVSMDMQMRSPPPVPPKTPLPYPVEERPLPPPPPGVPTMWRPQGGGVALPYPDTDGPPPVVNMARKPEFGVR